MQNLQFFYSYEKVLLAELAKCTGKAAETLKKELRVVAGGPNATPSLTRPVAVREYLVKQKLLTATAESMEGEE